MPRALLPMGLIITRQMTKWTGNSLYSVWNRSLRALLKKEEMFVLDAFKGHLRLDVKSCDSKNDH
jgi:hypothetical protein